MRSTRRFVPALDCLQARIAPSALLDTGSTLPATSGSTATMAAMDDTGSPGTDPTGYGTYPNIMTPPVGGTSTSTVC